jgi:hypothetical protein
MFFFTTGAGCIFVLFLLQKLLQVQIGVDRVLVDILKTCMKFVLSLFTAGLALWQILLYRVEKRRGLSLVNEAGDIGHKLQGVTCVDLDDGMIQDEPIDPMFFSQDLNDV